MVLGRFSCFFIVPVWFSMIPWGFLWFCMVPGRFSLFQVGFHGSRLVFHVFVMAPGLVFMMPGGFVSS